MKLHVFFLLSAIMATIAQAREWTWQFKYLKMHEAACGDDEIDFLREAMLSLSEQMGLPLRIISDSDTNKDRELRGAASQQDRRSLGRASLCKRCTWDCVYLGCAKNGRRRLQEYTDEVIVLETKDAVRETVKWTE